MTEKYNNNKILSIFKLKVTYNFYLDHYVIIIWICKMINSIIFKEHKKLE